MMRYLNLGIDFDGVITDPTQLKIDWIRENCKIELRPEQTVQEAAVAIVGRNVYKAMIADTYAGEWAMRNKVRPEAVRALRSFLGQGHKVFIITSRTDVELEKARQLIEHNDVPCTGFHNTSEQPKTDICRKWNIDLFLDDSQSKLRPLKEIEGLKCVFFNCFGATNSSEFENVENWNEFVELVRRMAQGE